MNRGFDRTQTSIHLEKCGVYCSGCYYKDVCHSSSYVKRCMCQRNTDLNWNGSSHQQASTTAQHYICHSCNVHAKEKLMSLREAREKAEMKRLTRQPLGCTKCKSLLPSNGPRWWVCIDCKQECRSDIHPAWAPRAKR
jgi:hypothetical protein